MNYKSRLCLLSVAILILQLLLAPHFQAVIADPAIIVSPLKQVKRLCIGPIIGDPRFSASFEKYLTNRLTLEGFETNTTVCDARLVGYLQTKSVFELTGKQLLAWADIKLVNVNHEILWAQKCHPYFTLKNPDFVRGDGRSGCAANIARELAKAIGIPAKN